MNIFWQYLNGKIHCFYNDTKTICNLQTYKYANKIETVVDVQSILTKYKQHIDEICTECLNKAKLLKIL